MLQEQRLGSLLEDETTALEHLNDVLQREYQALLDGDVALIERVTEQKNEALANQATSTQSRKYFAAQCTGDDTDAGMRTLMSSCSNRNALETSFSLLISLAEQCQDANRANGRLIAEKQQQAMLALNILRQTHKTMPTYSVQGKADSTLAGKSLGKA